MKPGPMLVLRSMILKEYRTTVRERQQLFGLAISVVAVTAALITPAMKMGNVIAKVSLHAGKWGAAEYSLARWVCIGLGVCVGTFFTLGYLLSAIVVSFAAEKENKTLELTLVSPISDTLLFVGKCVGVVVPSLGLGWLFIAVVAVIARLLYGPLIAQLPIYWTLYLLVLSVPLVILPSLFLVGVGAVVSAKAETAKGAGQVLGAVFFVIFFGGGWGIPLAVQAMGASETSKQVVQNWLGWGFVVQYLAVLCVVAVPPLISLAVGRMLFRRDRMLAS